MRNSSAQSLIVWCSLREKKQDMDFRVAARVSVEFLEVYFFFKFQILLSARLPLWGTGWRDEWPYLGWIGPWSIQAQPFISDVNKASSNKAHREEGERLPLQGPRVTPLLVRTTTPGHSPVCIYNMWHRVFPMSDGEIILCQSFLSWASPVVFIIRSLAPETGGGGGVSASGRLIS